MSIIDGIEEAGLISQTGEPVPVIYMIKFVDISTVDQPLLYKYIGSTTDICKRILQHLEAIWTGDSRSNGSLILTSVGNRLLFRFGGDLRFFRVEILKHHLSSDPSLMLLSHVLLDVLSM